MGFYGSKPLIHPSGGSRAAMTLPNTDGGIGGLTISYPPTHVEVRALRDACEELPDDFRAFSALVHALCTALGCPPQLEERRRVAVEVVKGGA